MTKDPNFVSVRLPDDVANWLREYATANKLVRADKPNMGGSIISIVRSVMQGQTISNNVGQSSAAPDVDIQAMINEAIANELDSVKASNIADYQGFSALLVRRGAEIDELKESIAPLLARLKTIEAVRSEATAPANFTQALIAESESSSAPETEGSSLEFDTLPIIEAISNIAAPTIENPLPDETLSDANAESNKSHQVTYSINHDGSVILRSLRGITIKALKRMNDQELKEIGLFKTLIGLNEKFFPSEYTAATGKQKTTKRSPKSKEILTRSEALEIAQSFNPKVIGQNLYDWAKAALTAKSEESKQSAKEKLAAVGLAPTYSNEGTIAWLAIAPTKQGESNENS
ncbi:hypothetical protein HCU40_19485 (plasmid) [Pseudanabaena biceps]|nr:hypothetical protein [Pseudanabaena biceps]